jgi:hypothetical protein
MDADFEKSLLSHNPVSPVRVGRSSAFLAA